MKFRAVKSPNDKSDYYYLEFKDPTGQRRRISSGYKLKREAEHHGLVRIQEWIAKHQPVPVVQGKARVTVDDFFALYESKVSDKQPGTIEQNRAAWADFAKYATGRALSDIEQPDVVAYLDHLKKRTVGKAERPVTASYVNTTANRLKGMFTFALDRKWCDTNPFVGVKKLKVKKGEPRGLDADQLESLLAEARQMGWNTYLFVALGAFAGMRRSEAIAARWDWFDLDNDLITIKSDATFRTKSGESRGVPLHSRLKQIVETYHAFLGVNTGYLIAPEKTTAGE